MIELASAAGAGTTATVRLPIVDDVPVRSSADAAVGDMAALRILVVDDEPPAAKSLERLLASQGHHVTSTIDAVTALRRYCEQPCDLVIVDLLMPGMDGGEFLRRLRMIDPDARVLVMTGRLAPDTAEQLRRDGALGVVDKPFVVEDVLAAIARCADLPALWAA
jgi:CheY-like chemotaxis protein